MTLGMTAQAAVLTSTCSAANNISDGTPVTITCSALSADSNFHISSITANGIGTWSDSSNGGATQHSFTYQFVMPSLTTLSFTSAVGTISGSKSGNTTTVANFGTSFIPGATLTLTAANGTSFPSSSSTGSLSLTAVQVADAQAPTPEPSTFALIGPVLLGLGTLSRRRR